jgi:hypothetical protein
MIVEIVISIDQLLPRRLDKQEQFVVSPCVRVHPSGKPTPETPVA